LVETVEAFVELYMVLLSYITLCFVQLLLVSLRNAACKNTALRWQNFAGVPTGFGRKYQSQSGVNRFKMISSSFCILLLGK
jgi:hypothetical protein